ncbi:formimidoylglutamate deiminase [Streptacidiphilus sp. ASG 303]|uniref:formimidoylglutamate deiminase n=1 Tax=Streptomycetaceae TaxID=2062 RepID=UPI001E2F7AAA|nr:formimidoylglutamate deiminase [Streptacidiphilus sp. ASG 303]MCD0481812.1 formimidoylglutamate deiminase [Streptacidiphilus sp. ASG 303]
MPVTTAYWAEHAWLRRPGAPAPAVEQQVLVEVGGDGRITAVTPGSGPCPPRAVRLGGLLLPGMANAHSHAFHRALRATVQVGSGTFWTWRDQMYRFAAALDPDTYLALATAVYAEMALAGTTCVGEFHYVHHTPGGAPYADPNAMGEALVEAAARAGIRITLLDTCYLSSGFGAAPEPHQRRFSDGDADAWAARAAAFADAHRGTPHARVGAAVHSVRAVPAGQLATVARWAEERGAPLHVHLSEQTAENDACLDAHGATPTRLLADHGVLGPRTSAVHATHLTGEDVRLLGGSAASVCMCPTTERDLADGIGPARDLADAGCRITLGSDSHAVVDPFEEARALELDERLRTRRRGHWTAAALLRAAGEDGHASLGWEEAGRIEPGALADLTAVALDSVRTAGAVPRLGAETAVFAASAADVRHVVVGGRHVVRDGVHQLVPDVPAALRDSIAALRGR